MTCIHCCGADKLFDLKGAQKEMNKYKKKGAGKSTSKLLKLLSLQDLNGSSLLDIGGGIGAIQWRFLLGGGANTLDVDASSGYLEVAKSYATEHGFMEKAQFMLGDFVDRSDDIRAHDFVTLDKVICCYPDYRSLLERALKRCNKTILISYPLGGPISKMVAYLNKIYFYFKKNPFRTYIHTPAEVEKFIASQGFYPVQKSVVFPWHVQVYSKIEGS